ncbi:hypothetical protein Tco_1412280, partial [Tanacetum coccineum]
QSEKFVEEVVSTAEVNAATTITTEEITLAQALAELRLLAERLQAREQEELSDEEKEILFVELLEKRKKHFAALRAQEKRNKPPTKLVEGSEKRAEDSTKRAGIELEQELAKKQKIDDAKVDDDQKEARMKELMNIVLDEEEVAINAIPLATKPLIIVDYKIIKEGKISIYQIIRANGSLKRHSTVIHMLRNVDKEDLETLCKIVKSWHGYTRPEEGYERVL